MADEPPHTRSFSEKMKRYIGDIDNALYKAEVACPFKNVPYCDAEECAFIETHGHSCRIKRMRNLIGEHFKQGDCMRMDANAPNDDKGQSGFRRECPT